MISIFVLVLGFAGSGQSATKCEQANAQLLEARLSAKATFDSLFFKRNAALNKYVGQGELAQKAGKIPAEPVLRTAFLELETNVSVACAAEKLAEQQMLVEWLKNTTDLATKVCSASPSDADAVGFRMACGILLPSLEAAKK